MRKKNICVGEQTGKQWATHSREQRSEVPRAPSKVRGAAGGRSRGRQEWRRAGKGGRRASWTWGFVWLLCGFYSSSVSPRLSWGEFGLQSRKVRTAADTNRSFKCVWLFTFVLSYKQTLKCTIWPEYLSPTSDWICMYKCACHSLRSHEISFLMMLVQILCVQAQIRGVSVLENQHFSLQIHLLSSRFTTSRTSKRCVLCITSKQEPTLLIMSISCSSRVWSCMYVYLLPLEIHYF